MSEQNKNVENESIQQDNKNPFAQDESTNVEETTNTNEEKTEIETEESEADKIQQELESVKNQYVRLAADFDNYRKRQAQERENLLKYGAEETLKKFLPVIDTFQRADESIANLDDAQKIKESFQVVYKQLTDALDKIGVKKIETTGVEFDINKHEAVMQTPTSEHPEHTVIAELQSGYELEGRVIRPAMVNVAVSE